MTTEVYAETVYVAWCEDCGHESEWFETRSEAQLDAAYHNDRCPVAEGDDPRDERQRFQDSLDEAVGRADS